MTKIRFGTNNKIARNAKWKNLRAKCGNKKSQKGEGEKKPDSNQKRRNE